MSRARDFANLAGSADAGVLTGRNLIINGAMQCWQRATAATAANNTFTTVDRFRPDESTDGAYTTEQSTDTPTGTGFSLKAQVTTADTSIAASQFALIQQTIEAQNCQSLEYGTSTAKSLTLSFFVKSSKTGIYTIVLRKVDTTAYHFVHEYTINSANTWEKKTITISPTAGSTTFITSSGGAIANDNGQGLQLNFNLAFGSTYNGGTNNAWSSNTNHYATSNQVNWMDSTSNNFYLAEVQLEVGEQATPFEHRSFGDELDRCQRYYWQVAGQNLIVGQGFYYSTSEFDCIVNLPQTMRASPTFTPSNNSGDFNIAYTTDLFDTWAGIQFFDGSRVNIYATSGVSGTKGDSSYVRLMNSTSKVQFDAEL